MELLFIYNAGSGIFDYVTDFAHKIISPSTYSCSLCALTYGNFGIKKQWSDYITTLQAQMVFLHKDELAQYHNLPDILLPAILVKRNEQLSILADGKTLNDLQSLDELINLLQSKLQDINNPGKQRA